jgi:hypothetical protein
LVEVTLAVAAREWETNEDGTLNIYGVFDEMSAPGKPCVIDHMVIVVAVSGDAAEVGYKRTISIPLMAPDGEKVGTVTREFVLPKAGREGSRPHLRLAFNLQNVLFPEPGPYHFSVMIDNDVKRTIPVYINVREGEEQ